MMDCPNNDGQAQQQQQHNNSVKQTARQHHSDGVMDEQRQADTTTTTATASPLLTTFGWIGTVLVNVAFVSLVTWGAVTSWPVGFTFCLLYTVLLFRIARWLRDDDDAEAEEGGAAVLLPTADDGRPTEEEEGAAVLLPTPSPGPLSSVNPASRVGMHEIEQKTTPILVSLVYGLAVLALGVTGSFLPVNLFPDNCPADPDAGGGGRWEVDSTILPAELLTWATQKERDRYGSTADFLYLPSTGGTWFAGSNFSDGGMTSLWEVPGVPGSPPQHHGEYVRPMGYTLIADDAACLFAGKRDGDGSSDRDTFPTEMYQTIACATSDNGGTLKDAGNISVTRSISVQSFRVYDALLWYKDYPSYPMTGAKVFSLDPRSMESTLYSYYVRSEDSGADGSGGDDDANDNDNDDPCSRAKAVRNRAFLAFFTVAMPVTLASFRIWRHRSIPSSAVTFWIGLCLVYCCLLWTITPFPGDIAFQLWFSCASAVWIGVLSHLLLIERERFPAAPPAKGPLVWGINAGSVCFFFGTSTLILSRDGGDGDGFLGWLSLTVLCFAPLVLFGIGTDCVLLVVLGAMGLMGDVWRFAMYLDSEIDEAGFLVNFIVLSLGGLCILGTGYWLNQRCETIKEGLIKLLECVWKQRSESSVIDEELSAQLLPIDEGETAETSATT